MVGESCCASPRAVKLRVVAFSTIAAGTRGSVPPQAARFPSSTEQSAADTILESGRSARTCQPATVCRSGIQAPVSDGCRGTGENRMGKLALKQKPMSISLDALEVYSSLRGGSFRAISPSRGDPLFPQPAAAHDGIRSSTIPHGRHIPLPPAIPGARAQTPRPSRRLLRWSGRHSGAALGRVGDGGLSLSP